jgi:tRNA dimethylallyltransferase
MASAEKVSAPAVWLIAGPTASGKSALALRLAQQIGGEIVNADASQLYADLSVLTARPPAADLARVPHWLYGVADGADAWSVGRWLRAVLPILDDLRARGRPAIVAGGTGLYFHALTRGLAEAPEVPDQTRAAALARYDTEGEGAFRDVLRRLDPAAVARIAAHDRQRLVRALAVAEATGRALSDWQADTRPALAADLWRGVVLNPPREALYARCDDRVAGMVREGVLDEVARLARRDLDSVLPVMKAVGYRWFAAHVNGGLTLDEAVNATAQDTRRYAKRQMTWFRNQARDWDRIEETDSEAQADRLFRIAGPARRQ